MDAARESRKAQTLMVLDSHVLYWWLAAPDLLSDAARRELDGAMRGEGRAFFTVVSLWELELKRKKGKLPMRQALREIWPDLRDMPGLEWLAPDADDWLLAAELPWKHGDPADRLIAAMALNRGLAVVTKDRKFHTAGCPVAAVW